MDDFESFRQYCENCTDAQVIAVYEKEHEAGRAAYAAIAKAVASRRGLL